MNLRFLITVCGLCAALTIGINLWFLKRYAPDAHRENVVRTHRLDLIDEQGKTRARIGMNSGMSGDPSQPEIVLTNADGTDVAVLTIERHGQGILVFNDAERNGRSGVVVLGYLTGSDTDVPEDPLGAWGLAVQTSHALCTGFGINKRGIIFPASAAPPSNQPKH